MGKESPLHSDFQLAPADAVQKGVAPQELTSHSDLTYRKLENLKITEASVFQSLLTGSLIRRCEFSKVNFQRSDLDGIRVEQCVFIECDFGICDIRSSQFAACRFQDCSFRDSLIDDCEFHSCEMNRCSFSGASQTGCRFHDSLIEECIVSPGTYLHNRLYKCSIQNMVLGDSAVLYVIMRHCDLRKVTLNAESIGGILGVTRDQIRDAKLVFLGRNEPLPADVDVVDMISNEYRKRKWYIGELVLSLNFDLKSPIGSFELYLSRTYSRFVGMGFAKGDEIQFVGDILDELATLEKLPLTVAIRVLDWCTALESALRVTQQGESESSNNSIRTLASRVNLLTNSLISRLDNTLLHLQFPEDEIPLTIRAVFRQKPEINFCDLLNSVTAASSLSIQTESKLIESHAGSYVEIVSTTLFSVVALQVFLFLVNGCIVQVTELKHRVRILRQKEGPKSYRDLALSPTQHASPMILSMLQGLARYSSKLKWLAEPFLSGFHASNIEKLEILKTDPGLGERLSADDPGRR